MESECQFDDIVAEVSDVGDSVEHSVLKVVGALERLLFWVDIQLTSVRKENILIENSRILLSQIPPNSPALASSQNCQNFSLAELMVFDFVRDPLAFQEGMAHLSAGSMASDCDDLEDFCGLF